MNNAFIQLKNAISSITYRAQPDINKDFILTTDASQYGISAILSQRNENNSESIISCYSKSMDKAQLNYTVTEKELLAIIKGLEHYRAYLVGKEFILKTDHASLQYLNTAKNLSGRMLRWSLKIQDFKFKILYIKGEENYADGLSRQLCINSVSTIKPLTHEQKIEILTSYHKTTGHGGVNNMIYLLKSKYSWPGMYNDIKNFAKNCNICKKIGNSKINTKNRIIITSRPNELWEVDTIGRLKNSNGENKFILVCIDHYSKWIEACVLDQKTAKNTASAIEKLIFYKHGTPERILSDNGTEFCNSAIKYLCTKYSTKWINNSPGHHKTMGCVERANQTLFRKLVKICNFNEDTWEHNLSRAVYASNISFNRAISTSPYALKHGQQPQLKVDIKYGLPIKHEGIQKLINKRDSNYLKYATKSIVKGKVFDKDEFSVGERVMIYKEANCGKFNSKWESGYTIGKKLSETSYVVTKENARYRLNKSHIKRE